MRARLRLLTICCLWAGRRRPPAAEPVRAGDDRQRRRHHPLRHRAARALLDALGAAGDLRELAVTQLTEDRVKLQAGEALGIELPEDAVAAGLEEFATTRGLTLDDVLRVLDSRGIDRQTMDDFVESGIVWREVVGTRFRARAKPTEAELDEALEIARTQPREMIQLAEIALPFAERGEAETLALAERLSRRARPRRQTSRRWRATTAAAPARRAGRRPRRRCRRRSCPRRPAARCCCSRRGR